VDSANTIAAVVSHSLAVNAAEIEVRGDTQKDWLARLKAGKRRLAMADCTPGIFNNEGDLSNPAVDWNIGYPEGPAAYFQYTDRWRKAGTFEGLTFCGKGKRSEARATTAESKAGNE